MLTAVSGYYNGSHIVMDEDVALSMGQRVVITILEAAPPRPEAIDLTRYMGRGKKMFLSNIDEYVKGLREDDRM